MNSSTVPNLTSSNDWPLLSEFVVAEPGVLTKWLVFPVVFKLESLKECQRISINQSTSKLAVK